MNNYNEWNYIEDYSTRDRVDLFSNISEEDAKRKHVELLKKLSNFAEKDKKTVENDALITRKE